MEPESWFFLGIIIGQFVGVLMYELGRWSARRDDARR